MRFFGSWPPTITVPPVRKKVLYYQALSFRGWAGGGGGGEGLLIVSRQIQVVGFTSPWQRPSAPRKGFT